MTNSPRVSVVVPVYNCESFLADCLESLAAQSYPNIEIIAVNDGSVDDSGSILDAFAEADSRLRVLHTPNQGVQLAWIAGVRESTGEYIGFVDGDDWVHPAMFETMMDAAAENGALLVQCGYVPAIKREDSDSEALVATWREGGWFQVDGREAARELLLGVARGGSRVVPSRSTKLFQRDLLVANLDYCGGAVSMGEDVNIVVPCLLDVDRMICLNVPLYFYRQNPQSMTNTYLAGFAASNAALLSSLRDAIKIKEAFLQDAEMEYFGWLTIRAIVNESRGPGGPWLRARRAMKVFRHPDAQAGIRLVRGHALDRTSRVVLYCCRVRVPLATPLVVAMIDWTRRLFRWGSSRLAI